MTTIDLLRHPGVRAAIDFAAQAHNGQERDTAGVAYVTHPLRVAWIVSGMPMPETDRIPAICAALLHDTVEDTAATIDQVRAAFADPIGDLVAALTKAPDDGAEQMAQAVLAGPPAAVIVKLADRFDNLQDMSGSTWPAKRREKYRLKSTKLLDLLDAGVARESARYAAHANAIGELLSAVRALTAAPQES
jgi:(p)ppGpp synthase/HD superfamily hydrolase